jgi:hypothetical protein
MPHKIDREKERERKRKIERERERERKGNPNWKSNSRLIGSGEEGLKIISPKSEKGERDRRSGRIWELGR